MLGYMPSTHTTVTLLRSCKFEPHCYPCTLTLTSFVSSLRSPSPPYITPPHPFLRTMKRNSTTSSSRRRATRPSLDSPTLQPSTSSRSRVHRDSFSYHWIFRSNIPKRRSLLFPNEIQKRNFFGMGEVFGVLANVRVLSVLRLSPRSPHASCTACTNPQIPNRSQESVGTDPQRFDRSQGTSTDQADAHFFTSTALCIFPPADRSQGNREHSYGSAQLDCCFWSQLDREGMCFVFSDTVYVPEFTDPYLLPSMGDSRLRFYDKYSQIPAIMYYISTFGSLVLPIWPVFK